MPSLVSRDSYAALSRCTYFNQAALGLIPAPTLEAMHAFVDQTAQFGNLYLSDEGEAAILDGVRAAGAELLGTTPDAVAVVGGASEGLGQITALLEPDGGSVVLVSTDFPSVTYPWLAAAQRRPIRLRFVDDRPDQALTHGLVEAIDRTTTVVAFSAVQYATGTRVDIEAVAQRAHEVGPGRRRCHPAGRGGPGAHGRLAGRRHGHQRLQVALGPRRRGHTRPRRRPRRTSPSIGGLEGHPAPLRLRRPHPPAGLDRPALRAVHDVVRLDGRARDLHRFPVIGRHRTDRRTHPALGRTARRQRRGLRVAPVPPLCDPAAASHIVSLRHSTHDPGLVDARLRSEHDIICGHRGGRLRISLHAYNNETDIDQLAEALARGPTSHS